MMAFLAAFNLHVYRESIHFQRRGPRLVQLIEFSFNDFSQSPFLNDRSLELPRIRF